MFKILSSLAKSTSRVDLTTLRPASGHIVSIPNPKPGMYGIPFDENLLLVDYASAMSFRVNYCNLGLHKEVAVYSAEKSFPANVLREYFSRNEDNPYSLMYVIGRLASRGDVTTPLTQVPPVGARYDSPAERCEAVEILLAEAQPMTGSFPMCNIRIARLPLPGTAPVGP